MAKKSDNPGWNKVKSTLKNYSWESKLSGTMMRSGSGLKAYVDQDGMFCLEGIAKPIIKNADPDVFCRKALRANARVAKARDRRIAIHFADRYAMVIGAAQAVEAGAKHRQMSRNDVELLAAMVNHSLIATPQGLDIFMRGLATALADQHGLRDACKLLLKAANVGGAVEVEKK